LVDKTDGYLDARENARGDNMTGSKQGGSHGDGHGRGDGYNRGGHGDGHIFRRFDSEMAHLHALVVRMAELAVSQLRAAVGTLERRDVAAARRVVENDKKLNDLDVEADDEIVRIIALRQPMAGDLREIIAVSKIVAELERAGDEARKIAGLTIRFYADSPVAAKPRQPMPFCATSTPWRRKSKAC